MSYTRNGNTVVFEYDADEVFEACALKSAYLSRRVKNPEGRYAGEEMVLTGDEREAFERCLKECVAGVWGYVGKMCLEGRDGVDSESGIVFKMPGGKAGERTIKIVDAGFFELLVSGVLAGWYKLCGEPNLSGAFEQEFASGVHALWNDLFPLRERGE